VHLVGYFHSYISFVISPFTFKKYGAACDSLIPYCLHFMYVGYIVSIIHCVNRSYSTFY